jgi:hypothetical protein
MFEMGSHDPFGHLKHKLWPKEGTGIKLAIWLPTTKSWESPQFPCVQVACYIALESFRQGYNFALNFISIEGLHTKLWAPKVVGILGFPLESLGTKCHLGVSPMARHRIYYKGESGGFPQVWAMINLVNPSLPVAHPSTKSALAMH